MPQPIVIDSLVFARQGRVLKGEVAIADLERVVDLLVDTTGSLTFLAEGRVSEQNRPQLLLCIDGVLSLRCQRCLEGVDYPLAVRSLLEFVENEDDLTQEELEDDSRDFLEADSEFDVSALIEDEILLGLPLAPRHDGCELPGTGNAGGVQSPFSVLRELKGKAQ